MWGVHSEDPQGGGVPCECVCDCDFEARQTSVKKDRYKLSLLQAFSTFNLCISGQVWLALPYFSVQEKPEYTLRFQKT